MSRVPETAMVLAAGLGTRMRPLTDSTAKPLIEVGGVTMIDRLLNPLAAAGVKRVVVNVHWFADKVEAHVKARTDLEVIISDERAGALETGGALAKARPFLGDEPIFVVNTDAFWGRGGPEPLIALAKGFDPDRMDIRLMLASTTRCLGFPGAGDFFLNEDETVEWRGEAERAPWAYAGVRIIKPELYDNAPIEPFPAPKIWKQLTTKGRLSGQSLDDFWLHVGTPESLADAEMWLRCYGK